MHDSGMEGEEERVLLEEFAEMCDEQSACPRSTLEGRVQQTLVSPPPGQHISFLIRRMLTER
jgi:hypothetical protein